MDLYLGDEVEYGIAKKRFGRSPRFKARVTVGLFINFMIMHLVEVERESWSHYGRVEDIFLPFSL